MHRKLNKTREKIVEHRWKMFPWQTLGKNYPPYLPSGWYGASLTCGEEYLQHDACRPCTYEYSQRRCFSRFFSIAGYTLLHLLSMISYTCTPWLRLRLLRRGYHINPATPALHRSYHPLCIRCCIVVGETYKPFRNNLYWTFI